MRTAIWKTKTPVNAVSEFVTLAQAVVTKGHAAVNMHPVWPVFKQCENSPNLTSTDDNARSKRIVNINFSIFNNCNFMIGGGSGSGAGEMVHAVSAVTLLISIAVATIAASI